VIESSSESSSSEENEDFESSASEAEKSDTEFQESNSQESNSQNSESCFGRPENLDSILGMDSSDEESTKRQEEQRKTRKNQKNSAKNLALDQTTKNRKEEARRSFMKTTNKALSRRLKKSKILKINTKNWTGAAIALNETTDKDVEDEDQLYVRINYLREQMFTKLSNLKGILPKNTLDLLIDKLGGVDKVAEMTGRKFRVVSDPSGDGTVTFERRAKKKRRNIRSDQ
jgi:hypothetical protein